MYIILTRYLGTMALRAVTFSSTYKGDKRSDNTTMIFCYLFDFTWTEKVPSFMVANDFSKPKN